MRLCICILVCLSLLLSVAAFAQTTPPKYHLTKTFAVGGEGGWDYLTCDARSHRLYVSRGTHVMVIDTEQGKVVGDIPNTQGVHGIVVTGGRNGGGKGFISNGRDNSVTIFDPTTLKETDRVKVGQNPDCIMFDRTSNRVFTFNGRSNDATAIDAETGKVVGTVPLGGKPEFAVSGQEGMIYVNIEDKSEIVSFDANTLKVINHWPLAPGEGPSGLAMDGQNHRLFSVCGNEKMVVLDSDTGKVITTLPIGKGPDAAAFSRMDQLAFSSNGQDGTLTVIQEETPDKFAVVDTVKTQVSARTMAIDRTTGDIYIAAAKYGPAPAAGGQRQRPPMEPNSFVILVFSK